MIPSLVSNDRIDVSLLHELTCLGWQVYMSITFGNQITFVVETFNSHYQLRPTCNVHTRCQEIKTQRYSRSTAFRFTKVRLSLCVLYLNKITSVSGVSSCHSSPQATLKENCKVQSQLENSSAFQIAPEKDPQTPAAITPLGSTLQRVNF